jgi:hypothetical protein
VGPFQPFTYHPLTSVFIMRSATSHLLLITLISLAFTSEAIAQKPNQLSEQELTEGWISLFDGNSLYGWRPVTKANWQVTDGAITVSSGKQGLLRTTSQFGNYRLKVDFQCPATTNSGIFLHTSPKPENPTIDCYEVNIATEKVSPFPTGSLVGRKKAEEPIDTESWHTFDVTLLGDKLTVKIDDAEVLSYTDPQPLGRGFIGLQFNEGEVKFRNIKLKPLGLDSLFNGKDLTGWRSHPESESKFSVTDEGELNVTNGRGLLETEAEYADFVLQLECISYGEHLNSGVFFRCIPQDFMMGYEMQIQNGYADGDRTKPLDCGTGGIFRRSDARLVNADDNEWFPMTLIAEGPHMAAWVNGVQVSDWTDTRKADENPRRGLRTAAGTFQIQGHDPTTNLSFRQLQASELPARGR